MRTLRFLGVFGLLGLAAAAVPSAAEAQTTIPVAQAEGFLGDWALEIDAQGQIFVMDLSISDASGNVAAKVSNEMMGEADITEISRDGENLVLAYEADMQGQVFPIAITLTPAGEELNAEIDFAEGQFTAAGKGTRK